MKFHDIIDRSEEKTSWNSDFFADLEDRYTGGDYSDPIDGFIHEAPHGLVSGGCWLIYDGDFYDFFNAHRAELTPVLTAAAYDAARRQLHRKWAEDWRQVARNIKAGKDADNARDIATLLFTILDGQAYIWAHRAAFKTGRDIDRPYFQTHAR